MVYPLQRGLRTLICFFISSVQEDVRGIKRALYLCVPHSQAPGIGYDQTDQHSPRHSHVSSFDR